ncbi:MAG: GAF domain-containing sensor histidine kinase, partial [Anaerolineales bacterium]|nr:GAF domain-containing sensor histidine kinase [Anaerolineales bacterium]
ILAQLRQVLPYYTAAVYLVSEEKFQLEQALQLERVVGPEAISGRSYTTPRRSDQIWQVYQEQQPRIFLSAHSRKMEDRAEQVEPVYCSMAAPLISASERLGVLTIDRFDVQPFVQDEVEILQAFANQAAIALRNARLYQQAQEMAVLQERNRLAQELHDAVSQTLFTASILAEAVPKVMQYDPEQGRQGLEEIQRLTRSALAEMRTLLLELRPGALLEKPLGDLLEQLARATSGRLRIPIAVQVEGDTILPSQVQVAFYRITQEAFNNIARHAGASQVVVQLATGPDQAQLSIRDDGRGFEIDEVPPGHFGLEIMRSRAEEIGADLLVVSRPAAGTRIEVHWTR